MTADFLSNGRIMSVVFVDVFGFWRAFMATVACIIAVAMILAGTDRSSTP
jgi:hypothetical protein